MTATPKARRKRIGKGIYRDAYGLSATVKVGTGPEARQREKRFPFDTPFKDLKAWQESMRSELRADQRRPVAAVRGTLAADATVYLSQVKHLTSYASRVCEVDAWTARYGRLRRSQITAEHVRTARATWMAEGYAPKTVNNRVQTLAHLYHVLDGEKAPTPADAITKLPVAESVKVLVPATVFQTVAANLASHPQTRARFMITASTGVRPAEVKRAEPGDVDLARRVWMVRTAKGGAMRAIVLNDEMLAAWKAFVAANAWGSFDTSDHDKRLYAAGWPRDVRPYQARHSMALELGERGIDLADVASMLGHKDVATTRRHYQGILASRLKGASDRLAGRFNGWETPAPAPVTDAADPVATLPPAEGVH
jgi:site-specific recombinase XerD